MATVAKRIVFMVFTNCCASDIGRAANKVSRQKFPPTARNKVEQIDLHQRQIQSLRVPIIWRERESRRSDWVRHCCHEASKADAEKEAHRR